MKKNSKTQKELEKYLATNGALSKWPKLGGKQPNSIIDFIIHEKIYVNLSWTNKYYSVVSSRTESNKAVANLKYPNQPKQ